MVRKKRSSHIQELIKFFEDIPFFIPLERLTEGYIRRLHELESRTYVPDKRSLDLQQKYLGQQVYLYLATLSKTPESLNGEAVDLDEHLNTDYFRSSIGLGNTEDDKLIILMLVKQFIDWLRDDNDGFRTEWGSIHKNQKEPEEVFLKRTHRTEPFRGR